MSTTTTMHPAADRSEDIKTAVHALTRAVYPPEAVSAWPGQALAWAPSEWDVLVHDDGGELVSYTGVLVRPGAQDGRPVQIGGIGGVKTHPSARGRGFAATGIRRALEFFREQRSVDFALLVCDSSLLGYYSRIDFKEFRGRLLIAQEGQTVEFTFNRVMVLGIHAAAPETGTIDLLGSPW